MKKLDDSEMTALAISPLSIAVHSLGLKRLRRVTLSSWWCRQSPVSPI
ncbi:hypothetical protein HID58_042401, partial [Brassica napus]